MPNDIQEITPKPVVPAWVTETPEPEETCSPFVLIVRDPEGEHLQVVDVTETEFVALKRHLARLRGYEIPEPEGETAATGAKPEQTKPASSMQSIQAGLVSDIGETLHGIVSQICFPGVQSSVPGDLYLLKILVGDWEAARYCNDFPSESPLLAAIRGNCNL